MPANLVFSKYAKGKLHSGSKSGPIVKNQKQAVAIKLSEEANEAKHGGSYVDTDDQPQKVVRNPRPKRKKA